MAIKSQNPREQSVDEEQLIRWDSIPGLAGQHIMQRFSFHGSDLELILKQYQCQNPRRIEVSFRRSVIMHRITNESFRIALGSPGFDNEGRHISTWPFYKVSNSQLIAWLLLENSLTQDVHDTLTHYICSDAEAYIDIVATEEPLVEWIHEVL